ncbi:hypothetical protein RB195_008578 [Necator americanus]|uniref:Uncharacterized protein n=1 Tax=Necator americanus TaxID=51031 RepID=A0ABR1CQ55_NECAM
MLRMALALLYSGKFCPLFILLVLAPVLIVALPQRITNPQIRRSSEFSSTTTAAANDLVSALLGGADNTPAFNGLISPIPSLVQD